MKAIEIAKQIVEFLKLHDPEFVDYGGDATVTYRGDTFYVEFQVGYDGEITTEVVYGEEQGD